MGSLLQAHIWGAYEGVSDPRFLTFRKLRNAEKCLGNIYPAPSLSNECYPEFPTIPIHQTLGFGEWDFGQWIVDLVLNTKANLATSVT